LAADAERPSTRAARERKLRAAVKTVATYLGNTPTVARASYIDPRVIDRYHAGATIAQTLQTLPAGEPDLAQARIRARVEAAVLDLLADSGG
jgi:DNA topoisomerase I